MIDWNDSCNWTYDEVVNAVTQLRDSSRSTVCLDCEHASVANMEQIVKWANSLGVNATISQNLEMVKLDKIFDKPECACDKCFHNCTSYCDFTQYCKKKFKEPDAVTDARLKEEENQRDQT